MGVAVASAAWRRGADVVLVAGPMSAASPVGVAIREIETTEEMAAAVAKISRLQDLAVMGAKCAVVTRFRSTIGLPGRLSVRLQPNHPTDDARGIAASILDGLLLGAGDAVIGINPATDSPARAQTLLAMLDEIREKLDIPTQSCVLAHVTTTVELIRKGAPVDLVFQSIASRARSMPKLRLAASLPAID